MFLTVFNSFSPFFCPKENCSRHSLQKSDVRDLLFSWVNAISFFLLQKNEQFAQKTMSKFPTLVFEPKSKIFGIFPIVPRANNMQMHKIWQKSEIDPLYCVHFT